MTTTEHDYAAQARQAIEIVCSGEVSRMEEFYSPDFVDHINDMTFHGYDGGRESLAFYGTLFKDYSMGVEEQVTEGNRVASRWILNGTYHGRAVTLRASRSAASTGTAELSKTEDTPTRSHYSDKSA
jgi:predicted ester cyclase